MAVTGENMVSSWRRIPLVSLLNRLLKRAAFFIRLERFERFHGHSIGKFIVLRFMGVVRYDQDDECQDHIGRQA